MRTAPAGTNIALRERANSHAGMSLHQPSPRLCDSGKRTEESGFEILFSDREQPESGPPSEWITARTGKHWVELASSPDGESNFLFTDSGSLGGSVVGGIG